MKKLISQYKKKKYRIKRRLSEFKEVNKKNKEALYRELCFCLLTPQSKAVNCDKAVEKLNKKDLLYNGSVQSIRLCLRGLVRFHNKKADYIVKARKSFMEIKKPQIKEDITQENALNMRESLVKNVKGLGYKEASHFLRNVGLGENLAILDTHILKNLYKFNVIREIPKSMTKKNYYEIEDRMRKFAKRVNIPIAELDLLFWSNQTGLVFK